VFTSLAASTSASTSLVSVVASLVSIAASACVVAVAIAVAVSVAVSVAVAVAVVAAIVVAVTVAIVVAAVVVVSVVVVGDLDLKVRDSCHELLHLFYHAVLLGCVCHFLLLELMLHLFGAQTFDYLVDDVGSICLVVGGNLLLWLTTLDVALGFLEMRLERWPGFSSVFFTVPFSDVAGEECGSGDDDETDVDEFGWRFSGFGRFGHVRVLVDGCEHGGDWLGMVVCRRLERGFGGG
jgi:hypothetical protein